MQALNSIDLTSALDTLLSLCAAFVLGGLIGLEWQHRRCNADLSGKPRCSGARAKEEYQN